MGNWFLVRLVMVLILILAATLMMALYKLAKRFIDKMKGKECVQK